MSLVIFTPVLNYCHTYRREGLRKGFLDFIHWFQHPPCNFSLVFAQDNTEFISGVLRGFLEELDSTGGTLQRPYFS